jgi:chromosome segregation ATPase
MAIVSLNMGNLYLEVSNLNNRLATKRRRRQYCRWNWTRTKDFQKECKHNIKMWRKNRAKNEEKIKAFIQKLQDENKEFKVKTTLMKSQDEELKELRMIVEAWEATKRKWVETLFHYKQQ